MLHQMDDAQEDVRPLTPWNPLDQFRLLWWLCISPARFVAYRNQAGEAAVRKCIIWLVSTLIWLPLFIPALANSVNLTRTIDEPPFDIPFRSWVALIPLFWLLTSLYGASKLPSASSVVAFAAIVAGYGAFVAVGAAEKAVMDGLAAFVVGGVALGVLRLVSKGIEISISVFVVGSLVGVVVGSAVGVQPVIAYFAGGISALFMPFAIASVLEKALQSGHASLASKLILIALALSYAVLIWTYLLNDSIKR